MRYGFYVRWTAPGREAFTRTVEGFTTWNRARTALATHIARKERVLTGAEIIGYAFAYGPFEAEALETLGEAA